MIRLRILISGLKVLKGDYCKVFAIILRICVVLSIVLLYLLYLLVKEVYLRGLIEVEVLEVRPSEVRH